MTKRIARAETQKAASVTDLKHLAALKARAEEAAREYKEFEQVVIDRMPTSTVTVKSSDGGTIRATLVKGERLVIDEGRLQKAVGAKVWNKITIRKFDRKKLDAAISLGEVSATTLSQVSEMVPNNPYLRLTVTPGRDSDD